MLNKIIVIRDAFSTDEFESFETDLPIGDWLIEHFKEWPSSARIYKDGISEAEDVTPVTIEDCEKFSDLTGEFFVVLYPEAVAIAIIAIVIAIYAITRKVPNVAQRNTQQPSPNNELAARSNAPRLNGRIPDIFGTVRSTPDLIGVPYSIFDANSIETELSMMCIGRGQYEILDALDGETPIAQINGSSVAVYKPFTNVSSGLPYYTVGSPITDTFYQFTKSNAVNGQTLKPANAQTWVGLNNVEFHYSGGLASIIQSGGASFLDYFKPGDVISLDNASLPYDDFDDVVMVAPNTSTSFVYTTTISTKPDKWNHVSTIEFVTGTFVKHSPDASINLVGVYTFDDANIATVDIKPSTTGLTTLEVSLVSPSSVASGWSSVATNTFEAANAHLKINFTGNVFNLNGTYTIDTVTATTITLVSGNSEWVKIPGGASTLMSPTIASNADATIGPFVLETNGVGGYLLLNFVAPSGIYKDDGKNQHLSTVDVEVTITMLDASNATVGTPSVNTRTIQGSATSRDQVGYSALFGYPGTGTKVSVKCKRTTPKDTTFKGSVVDDVKWRDLFGGIIPTALTFGNCTVLKSKTVATTGALSNKDRKLNLLVTRQIPRRISGSTFSTTLYSTNNAAEILSEICRDAKIGGRPDAEIDYTNIYDTIANIQSYFGTNDAAEFCYTFDKDGMTFEDTLSSIANAIFCTAYRQGSLIKLHFEKATPDSTLLFNHRNKVPKTEIRSYKFGYDKNYDGVAYTWVNPVDDAIETMSIPSDSINKPKRIESIGVRNYKQAYFHAWREYNKIKYQNATVEFEALNQASLALNGDRILVADNTRSIEQDGQIVSQSGFIVGTTQKVVFESGKTYTVFLQMYDGTVQSMTATAGPDAYSMTLGATPALPLVIDDDSFTRTAYILVSNTDTKKRAFLVSERINASSNTSKITAVNYDSRYYEKDDDFL